MKIYGIKKEQGEYEDYHWDILDDKFYTSKEKAEEALNNLKKEINEAREKYNSFDAEIRYDFEMLDFEGFIEKHPIETFDEISELSVVFSEEDSLFAPEYSIVEYELD